MKILRPSPPDFRGYPFAVLAVLLAALLHVGLSRAVGTEIGPLRIFSLAVLVSAWIGGWGPGLLATGLSFVLARYVFSLRFGWGLWDVNAVVNQSLFLVECVLISWLAHQFRAERRQGVVSREQFRLLHEGVDDCAIFTMTAAGRIQDWNERAQQMLGYRARDITGTDFAQLYDEAERAEGLPQRDLQRAIDQGRVTVAGWRVRMDGSPLWAETQLTALRSRRGALQGFAIVIADRSEEHQAEQELREYRNRLEELVAERTRALHESMSRLRMSERMAALGTLSAGLGHDMGNLLLPIRLRLEAMHAKGVPEALRDDVASIATCTDYLQRLSNGLRLMSIDPSKTSASPPATELVEWWGDIAPFLKNALRKGIELEQRLAPGLPALAVPRHLLTQAIFNLVQNAGQAFAPDSAGRVCVWAESARDGRNIVLGVTDDGLGMSEEVLARCMEPFFTSKTRGISTGLGLTLVHAMVQQVNGKIEVESTLGKGTTFRLTLPSTTSTRRSGSEQSPRPLASVDIADTRMRTYVGAILRSLGCEVSYTDGGSDSGEHANLRVADAHSVAGRLEVLAQVDGPARYVIFGHVPEYQSNPRFVILDEKPSPGLVRSTFQTIVKELLGDVDGVCNDSASANPGSVRG